MLGREKTVKTPEEQEGENTEEDNRSAHHHINRISQAGHSAQPCCRELTVG